MSNDLQTAFNEIAEMRALPQDVIIEALQSALVSAYRRDVNASSAQAIEARIDPATGRAQIFVEKEVTEDIMNPNTEVTLDKARFYDPECQLGDMVMVQVESTTKKFGRIAAQTAKQVILQKIREAERNSLYEEFIDREGDLLTGTVQSVGPSRVTLSLGRAEADLPRQQQIPGERYRQHEKLRVYVMEVKNTNRGPLIRVSRSHRNMLRRLLEYEVPEIYNGQVEIKSIAREAGHRSKVAVAALQEGIDPVGACVGMRGIRIQNIVRELHDEKIDVIEWNPDPEAFIAKALSPARVTGVYLDDDPYDGRTAVVVVPDDQLSLAIGREGQNARLAAKLTGWRIDIKSVTETVEGAMPLIDLPPLASLQETHSQLLEDVRAILIKKSEGRTIMPEDYNKLSKLADAVEGALQADREQARATERERVNAVRVTLPPEMFEIPVVAMGLSHEITDILEEMGSVGEVMLACLVDEKRVKRLLDGVPGQPMVQIQSALAELMMPETDLELPEETYTQEAETDAEAPEAEITAEVQEAVSAEVELPLEVEPLTLDEAEESAQLTAFGGQIMADEDKDQASDEPDYELGGAAYDEDDDDEMYGSSKGKKSKSRQKRRQLVFDEDSGQMIAKRRRKGNRKNADWNDFGM